MDQTLIINSITTNIRKILPFGEIYLYGSRARGDAHEDSDFDILVLLPDNLSGLAFVEWRKKIAGSLYEIEMESGADISLACYKTAEWMQRHSLFKYNVDKDKRMLCL
ncbi:MAG: nucleotidyltransferase domain-containing protein [Muribaculaceae bacterium]|nr:nucleotidyltransferase domain-containing protein [Muribaculaceae bacterium]